jgi:hypothetical protein
MNLVKDNYYRYYHQMRVKIPPFIGAFSPEVLIPSSHFSGYWIHSNCIYHNRYLAQLNYFVNSAERIAFGVKQTNTIVKNGIIYFFIIYSFQLFFFSFKANFKLRASQIFKLDCFFD